MTLARRVMGKYKDGALAITMYRAGAWLWFWEPLRSDTNLNVEGESE